MLALLSVTNEFLKVWLKNILICLYFNAFFIMVRHKNRYVLIEVNETFNKQGTLKLGRQNLQVAISKGVQQLHGDFGVAATQACFSARYCNEATQTAIIKARLGPHRIVASVLPLITSINKKPVTIRTIYVGATLRQCYKQLQCYQQRFVDKHSAAS